MRQILSLLALLWVYSISAQNFTWADHVSSNRESETLFVKKDGNGFFYAVVAYRDSAIFNGQTYLSYNPAEMNNPSSPAALVIRYTATGSISWVRNIAFSVSQASNFFTDGVKVAFMDVDDQGNVYLQGYSRGTVHVDTMSFGAGDVNGSPNDFCFLVKLNSSGSAVWNRVFTDGNLFSHSTPKGVSVKKDGSALYTMVYDDTLNTNGASDVLGGDYILNLNPANGAVNAFLAMVPGGNLVNVGNLFVCGSSYLYITSAQAGTQFNTVSTNLYQVDLNTLAFSHNSLPVQITDMKEAGDTLFLAAKTRQSANAVMAYNFGTGTTHWATYSDSTQGNWPGPALDINNQREVILCTGFNNNSAHFGNTPILNASTKNTLIVKLNQQGQVHWYTTEVSGTNLLHRAVSFADNLAVLGGVFNHLQGGGAPAVFGNYTLVPHNASASRDSYVAALGINTTLHADIQLPDTVVLCQGDSILLNGTASGGTGTYTYRWINGLWTIADTTLAQTYAFPFMDTTYYFQVSDGFGTATDSVRIKMSDSFKLFAFFFPKDSAQGFAMVPGFGPDDADSIYWDFGDGTFSHDYWPYHVYTQPGLYAVSLYIENFCGSSTYTDTVDASCAGTDAQFVYSFGLPGELSFTDQSISPTGVTSWLWTFGDGDTAMTQNPVHQYGANGLYRICLYITDSCGTDSVCQDVIISNMALENVQWNAPQVYPNPVQDKLSIVMPDAVKRSVQILSASGKVIREYPGSEQELHLSVESLPQGVYILKVSEEEQTVFTQLLFKR
ncbi:MAG TPA: hypothetical protein DCG19_07155 [Cryomorphaceae bacterium]|nr:hypothetical protein [Owenweeksia sp.]MBF97655.1 hypothetical protein [Owenweeksia sp.]HAD97168.1 hypothetical protein [Cryomorphaceae bacterium]HBF21284.1 hypothetical protein [Cryomorphaceae bacterium]